MIAQVFAVFIMTARNVITFGVNHSSSFHTDNRKNNFLISGKGPTFGIKRSFGKVQKSFGRRVQQGKILILFLVKQGQYFV